MSLNIITKSIDSIVKLYIKNISQKYNLKNEELLKDWNSDNSDNSDNSNNSDNSDNSDNSEDNTKDKLNEKYLLKCVKPELVLLCKSRGLKTTGTKTELISYLLDSSKKIDKKTIPDILQKIKNTIPTISIRKNQYGNHEDPNTSFIFDRKTKKVIGKQNIDGNIDELSKDDIIICNKYKYDYVLPFNLDVNSNLNDEKVDELDDEDEDEDVDVDIEDEIFEDEIFEEDDDVDDDFIYED